MSCLGFILAGHAFAGYSTDTQTGVATLATRPGTITIITKTGQSYRSAKAIVRQRNTVSKTQERPGLTGIGEMMKITGQIIEVGMLEGANGAHGIVIRRANGWVTVHGLTQDETRALAQRICQDVALTIEAPPGVTPEHMAAMVEDMGIDFICNYLENETVFDGDGLEKAWGELVAFYLAHRAPVATERTEVPAGLKPCPCCGGEAVLTKGHAHDQVWAHGAFHRVFCGSCQLRQLFYRTPAKATAAWNRRAPVATEPALTDAEIRAALELGVDLAIEVANETHERYKGWKPERHAAADADVKTMQDALAAFDAREPYAAVPTWQERCEAHPDHQGMVTHAMIHQRMQEEIDDLRAAVAFKHYATNKFCVKWSSPAEAGIVQGTWDEVNAVAPAAAPVWEAKS